MAEQARLAKVHSQLFADEYVRAGWTLKHEFFGADDSQPYEYILSWDQPTEPVIPEKIQEMNREAEARVTPPSPASS